MRKLFTVSALIVCALICGCSIRSKEYSQTFFAMDTIMEVKIKSDSNEALNEAEKEINRIDALLDRGTPDSEIYKINQTKSASVSDETVELIQTALSVSQRTNGAFDITTAPVTDLWGFYGGNFRVPLDSELKSAIKSIGYNNIDINGNNISLSKNASIDLGGIAKGYASDRAVKILRDNGVSSAIISLGGNVHALGYKSNGEAWNVGITDPLDKSQIIGSVSVSNKAVITSGGYQRYFEQNGIKYHHIIDPKTGKSVDSGLASVTVISDSGVLADALSTALFVMGLDKGTELWRQSDDFEAIFIDIKGNVYITEGISDSFNCDKNSSAFSIIK